MSWLENLNPVTATINAGRKIVTTIFGSKQERDKHDYELDRGAMEQFSAEFMANRQNRTWWDSLIDGVNRLPRPMLISMMVYYFFLSWDDPAEFAKINAGLATVPESMWIILGSIITFLFGARELFHGRKKGEFKEAAKAAAEMLKMREESEPREINMQEKYGKFAKGEDNG